jgi:hypothetical protein
MECEDVEVGGVGAIGDVPLHDASRIARDGRLGRARSVDGGARRVCSRSRGSRLASSTPAVGATGASPWS